VCVCVWVGRKGMESWNLIEHST